MGTDLPGDQGLGWRWTRGRSSRSLAAGGSRAGPRRSPACCLSPRRSARPEKTIECTLATQGMGKNFIDPELGSIRHKLKTRSLACEFLEPIKSSSHNYS